jgi:hypothetical protein
MQKSCTSKTVVIQNISRLLAKSSIFVVFERESCLRRVVSTVTARTVPQLINSVFSNTKQSLKYVLIRLCLIFLRALISYILDYKALQIPLGKALDEKLLD